MARGNPEAAPIRSRPTRTTGEPRRGSPVVVNDRAAAGSADGCLDDRRKPSARLGERVEVVLALETGGPAAMARRASDLVCCSSSYLDFWVSSRSTPTQYLDSSGCDGVPAPRLATRPSPTAVLASRGVRRNRRMMR